LFKSARELTAVAWGQELAIALGQCDASLSYGDYSEERQSSLFSFAHKVKLALRDVWKEGATEVFDIGWV
jgi:cohesin loading factor subunit SCC2